MDATALYHSLDTTALYYTFSTIAQTLAGALAVLVAFALFRLTKLDEALAKGRGGLIGRARWQTHFEALLAGDVEGLVKSLGVAITDAGEQLMFHEAYVAAGVRARIIRALRWALAATVFDIAFCFMSLPLTPALARPPVQAWTAAGVAVALGLMCLGLYMRFINTLVYRPDD